MPFTYTDIKKDTLVRLKAIENISYACSSLFSTNLNILSDKVLKPFCKLTGAEYGIVVLLNDNVITTSACYGFPEGFIESYNKAQMFFNDEANKNWPSIKSMRMQKIVIIKDTNHDELGFSRFFVNSIKPNRIRAIVSVPLIINGEAIGAFTKYYLSPQLFDEADISFMKTTANIITNTIERNMLIEEAQKSKKELAQTNKELTEINKELDSFVYIASHDLREPLRTIESFIGILKIKAGEKFNVEETDFLNRIIKATQKMRTLIKDLTDLSRASKPSETDEESIIDLNHILTEVQFELTAQIQNKNAEIIIENELPKVKGDREKIASVFRNLISNGIKFNESEYPIIKIRSKTSHEKGKLYIQIEDNGIGIDAKYKERVFDLFRRLHSQDEYEGTGAGLAIVKKILEKYRCDIWIESEKGKGSKFNFTLIAANELC